MTRLTKPTAGLTAGLIAIALGGCVTSTRTENAALRMPRAQPPAEGILAYASPSDDYPTVGGDILKGNSPADLAAARAAATELPKAPAKP